jgi:ABC-type branched-subunit amino acid transport system ATPase component
MSCAAITAEGLGTRFGRVVALDGVDLELAAEELVRRAQEQPARAGH